MADRDLPSRPRYLALLPLGVTLLGLGLTALLVAQNQLFQTLERERLEEQVLKAVTEAVQVRLAGDIQILQGITGLFSASQRVTRQEFRTFYDSLALSEQALAGIQGVGYSRWIPAAELSAFVAGIEAEGFSRFRVYPIGARPFYSAITYLEPFNWRNQRAFGFDMWSNPIRRQAMARARDTGLPSLSGKLTLVQETGAEPQAGALVYLPIYRQGMPLLSVADRQQALSGWAYSPLRMGDFVRAALTNPLIRIPAPADIQIFDGRPEPSSLLYDSRSSVSRIPPMLDGHDQSLEIAGRRWQIRVALASDWQTTDPQLQSPFVVILSGAALSCLMGLATLGLVRQYRRTQQALAVMAQVSQERLLSATVFSTSPEGIVITDPEARILQINPAFTRLTGYSAPELLGQNPRLLQSGMHGPEFFQQMWHDLLRYGSWEGELWNRNRQGGIYRQALSITAVRDARQQVTHYVGLCRDVTHAHREREQVLYQSQHDYLTDLPNRALLMDRLELALRQARRYDHELALLFLDLDRFKPINDLYGHSAGDWVLRQVANRLQQQVRASDTVCRQGGDEFVLLIPEIQGLEGVLILARKLQRAIEQPYRWQDLSLQISVSIGIAIYPNHGLSEDELIAAADAAMYQAKHGSAERIEVAPLRSPRLPTTPPT